MEARAFPCDETGCVISSIRGSSIALNALVKHVRPIYVDTDDSHALTNIVDPSLKWCRVFQNTDQLTRQINEDRLNERVASQIELDALAKASKYGADYFVPFNLSPILKALKALKAQPVE